MSYPRRRQKSLTDQSNRVARDVIFERVDDGIWLVGFMHYDLGYFDLERETLQPLDDPLGARLSAMSWVRSVTMSRARTVPNFGTSALRASAVLGGLALVHGLALGSLHWITAALPLTASLALIMCVAGGQPNRYSSP